MRSAIAALLVALAPLAHADTPEQKRDALVAQPWFKENGWTADLEMAKEEAAKSRRLIFAYYTVVKVDSQWCREFEKDVLSKPEWKAFAKKYVLWCQITCGAANETTELLHAASGRGWPWFAFLDAGGGVILAHRGSNTIAGFEETAARATHFVEVRKKAAHGGNPEKADLLIAALAIGKLRPDDAKKRLGMLGVELTDAQKKELDQAATDAVVGELAMNTDPNDEPAILAAGKTFLDLKKAGKYPRPTGDLQAFWIAILRVAQHDGDVALYEEGVTTLKKQFGSDPSTKEFFDDCEKTLAALKAKKK